MWWWWLSFYGWFDVGFGGGWWIGCSRLRWWLIGRKRNREEETLKEKKLEREREKREMVSFILF